MFSLADLPDVLPLFPLPGALLLPRTRLPLNIFEPRYLAMLDDTLKTSHRLIGMVQPIEKVTSSGQQRVHLIGCAGRVVRFSETTDHRYMIELAGICRFRIKDTQDSFAPYLRASVEWSSFHADLGLHETDTEFDRAAFLSRLDLYFRSAGLTFEWDSLKEAEDELLINSLSMLCPFDVEDKQALLEAPTLADRRETLVTLIEFALRGGGDESKLQ